MCLVCYSPGIAIGELTMVGGPFVAAAVIKIKQRLGYESGGDEFGGSDPDLSQANPTAASVADSATPR